MPEHIDGFIFSGRSSRVLSQQDELTLGAFDRCLIEGVTSEWWNHFITLIKARRSSLLEDLATTRSIDQREEDAIRGKISELAFIISLDQRGRTLRTERKDKR